MADLAYFLTGTDTGVGKTGVCVALIEVFKQSGYRVAAMKPVATGGTQTKRGMQNLDALRIHEHINTTHDYPTINPVSLSAPAAPLIAAKRDGVRIEAAPILAAYQKLSGSADVVLLEGVGGWHIRLDEDLWMSDLVGLLNLPVIMVVGIRLGCINHAVLTAEAVVSAGCRLHGWIANHIDQGYPDSQETLALLKLSIKAPLLAAIPYLTQPDFNQQVTAMATILSPCLAVLSDTAG